MITLRNPTQGLVQRVAVADLTINGLETLNTLRGDSPVEVVYSDPPWSPGNEKWWRRYNKVPPPTSYDAFLDGWCCCVASCRPAHVLVEQSVNPSHHNMLLAAIERCASWGLPLVERFTCCYGNPKRPNVLMHFGGAPLQSDPTGLAGEGMSRTAFEGLALIPGMTVVDPCTGLGMTSRLAHHFGLNFVGTELNPARLDRTIQWLLRHGYSES